MSNTQSPTNPMASMFELQRQSIKQSHQFVQQSMNAQKQLPRVMQDAIDSQRSVQQTGLSAGRSLAKGMVEMMQASIPSEQPYVDDSDAEERQHAAFESLHQALDDQFEAVEEISDQSWEALESQLEENTDAFVEFVDQSSSFTDESIEAFLESLEDVQSDVEEMEFGVETGSEIGTTRRDTDVDDDEMAYSPGAAMSETTQTATGEQWGEYVEAMNQSFVEAFEQNMRMQTEFLESWRESLDETTLDETTVDGMQGMSRAYEVWMEAADAQQELLAESLRGEEVDIEAFRDLYLDAANEAFKEVMGTSAFAAATGQTVGDMLEASEQLDRLNQQTLESVGFATVGDIEEIGERLVELERRQHAVEGKLDQVIAMLEDDS